MKMKMMIAAGLAVAAIAGYAVPRPWAPPTLDGTKVGVWGREYAFASNALPVAVTSLGRTLTTGPMRVVCADEKGDEIAWIRGGSFVQERDDESVTICGFCESCVAAVDAVVRVEFDGMAKVSLAFVPGPDANCGKLTKAWLEIPLRADFAKFFNYSPCSWARIENVGSITGPIAWPFRPVAWIGDEKAGFSWFCESDEKFLTAAPGRVIEIVPGPAVTLLRIRLADQTFELPRTFVFGFEATPARPCANFHASHTMHSPRMGIGISGVKRPEVWWTSQRAFPDDDVDGSLDAAQRAGVRTICFHEDWIPVQNNATPQPAFKAIVDKCHARGIKALVYQGFELSPLDPKWGELFDDSISIQADGRPVSFWYRAPGQRDYRVCYAGRFAETWLARAKRAYETLGLDGFYLDGTIMPRACANERHGCGWRDAGGKLHATYPIFAVRRMMRELYEFVDARGGRIDAHQSGYLCPATLAFAHSYWDGEQVACQKAFSPKAVMRPDVFRAEFMGVNHGPAAEFLAYTIPGQWSYANALAVSLAHNVTVRPCGFASLGEFAPVWRRLDAFGFADAVFHPYWENGIATTPESVKASYWQRADGRRLYVISNLDPEQAVDAHVELPGGAWSGELKSFNYVLEER